jgi:Mg-chelatase subunit ChlD
MKKILRFSFVLLFIVLLSSTVFAGTQVSKNNATMKLVEDNVCDISFGKYGTFEKKMTNIDVNNKTIDISLTAKNNATAPKSTTHTETALKNADIVFLIDNSNSMTANKAGEVTRKQAVLNATNDLIDKIFEKGDNIKIGVVKYATSKTATVGSENDATIVTPSFVSTADTAKDAIKKVQDDTNVKDYPTTDIEAGLTVANKLLNTETDSYINKIIVLLTDGIPNYALNVGPVANGQGFESCYDEKVFTPTKNKLVELNDAGVNVMSVLINMSNDEIQMSTMDPKPTYKEVATDIFGTQMNPTAGPIYYVSDSDIADTITNSIFSSLTEEREVTDTDGEEYSLTDIVIKDYFPDYIINNFDFAYLTKPEKGEVSAEVDKQDNSITWTISKLDYGETATFTYRLKLKDSFDGDIIAKNLKTNKNVTINYKENGKDGEPKENDKCPVVILDVLPSNPIPKTGTNTFVIATLAISGVVIAIVSIIKFKKV